MQTRLRKYSAGRRVVTGSSRVVGPPPHDGGPTVTCLRAFPTRSHGLAPRPPAKDDPHNKATSVHPIPDFNTPAITVGGVFLVALRGKTGRSDWPKATYPGMPGNAMK